MPSDIKLDRNTHDIDLSTQRVELFEENPEVLAQRIKIALLLRAGEWFANISKGVPYLEFSRFKRNKSFADSVMIAEIESVDGVEELETYSSTLENNRKLVISFAVKTYGGEIIELNLEV